jgi:hypothetical protein
MNDARKPPETIGQLGRAKNLRGGPDRRLSTLDYNEEKSTGLRLIH